MHLCTHKDTSTRTHTKYIKPLPKEGKAKERNRERKRNKQEDTEADG